MKRQPNNANQASAKALLAAQKMATADRAVNAEDVNMFESVLPELWASCAEPAEPRVMTPKRALVDKVNSFSQRFVGRDIFFSSAQHSHEF